MLWRNQNYNNMISDKLKHGGGGVYTNTILSVVEIRNSREVFLPTSTQQKTHSGVVAVHSPSYVDLGVQSLAILVRRDVHTLTLINALECGS